MLTLLNVPLGSYAEYVVVPVDSVAPVPAGLDPVTAASVPLNALTADQALDLLDVDAGSDLLVTGAAGAVGGYLLPLALARGFRVTGLARQSDAEFVRASGAEFLTELPDAPRFDAVIDAASLVPPALDAVRSGGQYVGVTPADVPESVRDIRTGAVRIVHDGDRLAQLLQLAADGTLAVRIAGTLPLAEAGEAHRMLAKGGTRGRYLLVP